MPQPGDFETRLLEKIRELPPHKRDAVENLVDFLLQADDDQLVRAVTALSEDAFRKVWDNPEDSEYDGL